MVWLWLAACAEEHPQRAGASSAPAATAESAVAGTQAPDSGDPDLRDTATEDTGEGEDTGTVKEDDETPRVCDWGVYDEAVAYAEAYPLRDGASWSGWCASLMWRFASMPESAARASAILAYGDSRIESLDPRLAPSGAFHWWDIGAYGHVGMDLLGGGGTVFMASSYVLESWGSAIGVTSVTRYTATTAATYLGWSMDYAGSTMDGGGQDACDGWLDYTGVGTVPVTSTQDSGVPNTTFYMRLQLWASLYDYTGPIDGVPGQYTWKGVQRGLLDLGYSVDVTGTPDTKTYAAIQSVAALYGYTGPIDGIPGPNTYRGFAQFLNTNL